MLRNNALSAPNVRVKKGYHYFGKNFTMSGLNEKRFTKATGESLTRIRRANGHGSLLADAALGARKTRCCRRHPYRGGLPANTSTIVCLWVSASGTPDWPNCNDLRG